MAHRSIFASRRLLNPNGIYIVAGGTMGAVFQSMLLGPLISLFGSRRVAFLMADSTTEDLVRVTELMESGDVKPVIDRCFPLSEVPEALQYMGEGHALGKVIITM